MSGFSNDAILGYPYYVGFKKWMGDIKTNGIPESDIPKYVHKELIKKHQDRKKQIEEGYDGIISNSVWVYANPNTFDAIISECTEFKHGARWDDFIIFYI